MTITESGLRELDQYFFLAGCSFLFMTAVLQLLLAEAEHRRSWRWLQAYGVFYCVALWLNAFQSVAPQVNWIPFRGTVLGLSFLSLFVFTRTTYRSGRWLFVGYALVLAGMMAIPYPLVRIGEGIVAFIFGISLWAERRAITGKVLAKTSGVVLAGTFLAFIPCFLIVHAWIHAYAVSHVRIEGDLQAQVNERALSDYLHNADELSRILSQTPEIREYFLRPSPQKMQKVQATLDRFKRSAEDLVFFLTRPDGIVVDTTSRDDPESLLGINLGRRPYLLEAMLGNPGQHFGVGTIIKTRAYYSAHPVRDSDGFVIGVVTARLSLERPESLFPKLTPIFIVDRAGVVLMSNQAESRLQALWPIEWGLLSRLRKMKLYGDSEFKPVFPKVLDPQVVVRVGRSEFLPIVRPFSSHAWKLVLLNSMEVVQIYCFAVISGFGMLLLALFGGIIFSFGRVLDLQEQVRFQRRLIRQVQHVLDSIEDAVFVIGPDARIMEVNQSMCEQLGYTRDELLNRCYYDLITSENGSRLERLLSESLEARMGTLEMMNVRKDGTTFPSELRLRPIQFHGTQATIGVSRDIADRKLGELDKRRVEAQLYHSEKLASIGTMAAGVAHEINNPLTIIAGYLGLMKDDFLARDDADARTWLDLIARQEKGIERISGIVNSLRTYARADTMHLSKVDLHGVVRDTVGLASYLLRKNGVNVELKLDATEPFVRGNIGKLQQVIMNLIVNARDALQDRDDARVTVETSNVETQLVLRISDNGPGIPAHLREKVFEPFFTTKPAGIGTGMGLSIILSIVEASGGRVVLDSAEGQGTSFTIYLPRDEGSEEEIVELRSLFASNAKRQVYGRALLVDDEPELRHLIKGLLISFGLEVDEAVDGQEALEKLRATQYGVVVTDLKMPRMGGDALLEEVEKLNLRNTRFIVVTGGIATDYSAEQRQLIRRVAHSYLKKPFRPEELWAAVSYLSCE